MESRRCAGTKSAPGMVKKTISKSGHKSVSGSYVLLANHRIFESDKSSIYEYLPELFGSLSG